MAKALPDHVKLAPFLVFYLVHGMQIGSGLLGFQNVIAKQAGYDAWIMVTVTGVIIHVSLWMIFKIVETVDGDLVSAHTFIFGNIVGKTISALFIIYFILLSVTAIRSYVEVIQVWVFPKFNAILFTIPLLILVAFIIGGGLKTVGGVAVFGAIIPIIIYASVLYTIKYAEFQNLLPVFDHSLKEMTMAGYWMSLSYIGYDLLLVYYPFINDPKSSKKWAHLALVVTMLLYTYIVLFSFAYFSEGQLTHSIWPTLTMWKIVRFPLIERFEYIGIATWMFMILPNICIALWASSRMFKRIFPMKMRTGLYISIVICFIGTLFFKTTLQVELLKVITSRAGLIITYGYIPILLLLLLIAKRVRSS